MLNSFNKVQRIVLSCSFLFCFQALFAQDAPKPEVFTHTDSLRGMNGPYRTAWNVLKYEITVKPDFASKTIEAKSRMLF